MPRAPVIAIIGAGDAPPDVLELAHAAGAEIAACGATLVCGGRGGVMAAAARGAREHGGHTIGIVPGYSAEEANPYIEFVVATGMGEARNAIVVATAEAVIAMAGEGGTLSEVGLALKLGRPVVALRSWPQLENLHRADDAPAAVAMALELCGRAR
ncbi:MAG TPA: TIGR00725 family protein [Candidatus Binataceae bacterium]|nr:TIGR00725 family protein [Candidatus Binataceae bacterium]